MVKCKHDWKFDLKTSDEGYGFHFLCTKCGSKAATKINE